MALHMPRTRRGATSFCVLLSFLPLSPVFSTMQTFFTLSGGFFFSERSPFYCDVCFLNNGDIRFLPRRSSAGGGGGVI